MLIILRSFGRRHVCLTGIVCLLLLLFGATVQLAHSHTPHENHADCSLCVTAHAAVEIVILPSGFIAPVTHVERPTSQAPHLVTRFIFAHPLWNRPPPASLFVA
jgi:hypothetical protein